MSGVGVADGKGEGGISEGGAVFVPTGAGEAILLIDEHAPKKTIARRKKGKA